MFNFFSGHDRAIIVYVHNVEPTNRQAVLKAFSLIQLNAVQLRFQPAVSTVCSRANSARANFQKGITDVSGTMQLLSISCMFYFVNNYYRDRNVVRVDGQFEVWAVLGLFLEDAIKFIYFTHVYTHL